MAAEQYLSLALSVEHQLLLALSHTKLSEAHRSRALKLLQNHSINWEYFISAASKHGVLIMVYTQLQQIAPHALPSELSKSIKKITFQTSVHNLVCTNEMVQVISLLKENNIRVLTYKGPTLAQMMYGNIAMRYFADIDLLVSSEDLAKAKALIIERGYYPYVDPEHSEFQTIDADRSYQGFDLIRNDGQVALDLQERSGLRFSSFSLNFNELWTRRQDVAFGDKEVSCPSMEDYLWMLCAHGTQHRWYQLKWICDIAQLIETVPDLDWHLLLERAGTLRTSRMVYIGILAAHFYLDAPIPNAIRLHIESDKVAVSTARQIKVRLFEEPQNSMEKLRGTFFDYNFDLTVRPYLRDKINVIKFLTRRRLNRRLPKPT